MKLEKRKPSGREKDEASIKLLEKLQGQLYSSNASDRRQAAFNLSWLQEDGLEILKAALFADSPTKAKNASAYGLRKMRGRMKKMALEVLGQGLKHDDSKTKEVCKNALSLLSGKKPKKAVRQRKKTPKNFNIRDIPRRGRPKRTVGSIRTQRPRLGRNRK